MDDRQGLFPGVGGPPTVDEEQRSAVLAELMGQILGSGTAAEERLAASNPALHFKLRAVFGSFGRGLSALWDELPAPSSLEPVRDALRRHWETGQALDQAYFMRRDPILGKVLLQLYENLDAAIRDAGLDPVLARRSRVLSEEEIVQRARVVASVLKNRVGKDWEVEDPLLMMNVRSLHHSYLAFFAWLDQRLDANSVLILVQQKKKLLAVPVDAFRESGRGGLGRSIGELKYEKAFHCRSRSVLVFTASGWVHRIPSEWIPVIGQPEAEFKLEIRRGDRIAAVLDEPSAEELLILISEKGRVKAVPRDDFRRFPAEGARCLGLEEKDVLALAVAARFDGTPLAVFSRKGRALRLPMDSIRLKSRQARGVIQLRFHEEQDGPVAAFQLSDEDPYLVASPDGRVKAGLGGLVPLRLNGGSGVIVARGQVAGAASLICAGIGLLSRGGRLLVFSSEELRILSRGARGVKGLALRGNDRLDFVFST